MTEFSSMRHIGGYDFDQPADNPRVQADYDLYGSDVAADMLLLDRISETARLGGAALFPERAYIVRPGTAEYDAFAGVSDQTVDELSLKREDQDA